jgi:hypothetical protein
MSSLLICSLCLSFFPQRICFLLSFPAHVLLLLLWNSCVCVQECDVCVWSLSRYLHAWHLLMPQGSRVQVVWEIRGKSYGYRLSFAAQGVKVEAAGQGLILAVKFVGWLCPCISHNRIPKLHRPFQITYPSGYGSKCIWNTVVLLQPDSKK